MLHGDCFRLIGVESTLNPAHHSVVVISGYAGVFGARGLQLVHTTTQQLEDTLGFGWRRVHLSSSFTKYGHPHECIMVLDYEPLLLLVVGAG